MLAKDETASEPRLTRDVVAGVGRFAAQITGVPLSALGVAWRERYAGWSALTRATEISPLRATYVAELSLFASNTGAGRLGSALRDAATVDAGPASTVDIAARVHHSDAAGAAFRLFIAGVRR